MQSNQQTRVRTALVLALIGAAAMVIAACNTMEGLGRDVKAGGKALENAASDSK